MQLSGVLALLSSTVLLCTADPLIPNPADYVLPFIGTTNGGHVFPGMNLTISIYLDAVLIVLRYVQVRLFLTAWSRQD